MTIMSSVAAPFKAGATPNTFDGNTTITVHSKAREIIGMIMGWSLSAYTTEPFDL
jgi:hypothetical protein